MNIYISNLSYDVTDNDLKALFEEFGQVSSAKVITDRYTGKSRGFGFVEMAKDEEARKAIEKLDKSEHSGKTLTVNEARPKSDRPRSGGRFGGGRREGGYNSERRSNNRY